jgi:hypothetical protein
MFVVGTLLILVSILTIVEGLLVNVADTITIW